MLAGLLGLCALVLWILTDKVTLMDIDQVKRWYWIRRLMNKFRHRPKSPPEKLGAVLNDQNLSLILDVGANIGQSHDLFRSIGYTGRIVSFEPLPGAHATLTEKATSDANWQIAPRMAIGDRPDETVIRESEASDVSSIMEANASMHAAFRKTKIVEEHPTIVQPLDAIYDDYARPDDRVFLKIDTQGYDLKVLQGATETLKKITGLQIEMSLFPLYEGEASYLEIMSLIDTQGFEPYILSETNFSQNLRRQLQVDGIFFRKGSSVKIF